MREGSLEAPVRHAIDWENPDYVDPEKLDGELRRVFDICHGCRRCFNLCDSFPRLFDLVDQSATAELDGVASSDFKSVVDACTLCDMCFMTKCPYVPPHEFNLDFPHLMLRHRVAERRRGVQPGLFERQLTATDRNGQLARLAAPLANWASRRSNGATRPVLEGLANVHRDVELPPFHGKTFLARSTSASVEPDPAGPAHGRRVVLYATCFVNYNNPGIGEAAVAVLARQGIRAEVVYPECCGMPQLEGGEIDVVAAKARRIAATLRLWIDQGYDVVALTPSCALMLKFEWPLIVGADPNVRVLADATFDITEYLVDIAKKEGLAKGLQPLSGGVAVHLACHARAQNMGPKAAEMLRLIPDTKVDVIDRCSGHGGSWGIKRENFPVALKVGRPTAQRAVDVAPAYVAAECPLAGKHIVQGMERTESGTASLREPRAFHPIELLARSYGDGVRAL
ncbi:MAG: glycerol-3-phosphate dehydrogenase [Alphaproteobacteria bacterium]|nr:glycerol-3-phosphate dehydrogenase [Alphaproteobacteria bacterium]